MSHIDPCHIDPWEKAADCARAIEATTDVKRREILINIRDLWIALANEDPFLDDAARANQIAAIDRAQANLMVTETR